MQNALVELQPTAVALAVDKQTPLDRLIDMALANLPSKASRRLYSSQLRKFAASGLPLNREGVALHLKAERERGVGGSTITATISAIRKLVEEASIRGAMSADEVHQIRSLTAGKTFRSKVGLWLTVAQVRKLRDLPDRTTFWGKRDAAFLSIMVGCGLRRAEMASLRWEHYQERDGRPCLVDFEGKGRKSRTVPVPTWAIADVEVWKAACQLPQPDEPIAIRRLERNRARDFSFIAGGMKEDTVHQKVQTYGKRMGLDLNPHDLRRTLAQMMRKAGAPLEQIQATLGHESIETTMIYLGSCLELSRGKASVDVLDLERD